MKSIAFCWWWDRVDEILPFWCDGLRGALHELQRRGWTVNLYKGEKKPKLEGEEFILFWGDSHCPFFHSLNEYKQKKGIILTTDPVNIDNLKKVDIVFCESEPIYQAVREHGLHAVKAFGTDATFYHPDTSIIKDIPYFYPATFSPWKLQNIIAGLGPNLYCLGTVQPDGSPQWDACEKAGVCLYNGYVEPHYIRTLYQRAHNVIIPAIHGSERTCLESMACDILPHVNANNKRTYSYIQEFWDWLTLHPLSWTRDFILTHYSEVVYANQLQEAINELSR